MTTFFIDKRDLAAKKLPNSLRRALDLHGIPAFAGHMAKPFAGTREGGI